MPYHIANVGAFVKRAAVATASFVFVGAAAAEQFPDFYYDTTQGASFLYSGDLTGGTFDLSHIDGRSFRAQRVPGDFAFGTFGGQASLEAQLDLVSFTSMGMGGPGDIATFQGTGMFGGFDFLVVDEFGESFTGLLPEIRFVDRTDDPFIPGVVGTATATHLEFSGATFQGISLDDLTTTGSLFTFAMVIPGVTLEDYLATGGLGGTPIPLDTLQLRVIGIPAAPTASLVAIGALALSSRRRRA